MLLVPRCCKVHGIAASCALLAVAGLFLAAAPCHARDWKRDDFLIVVRQRGFSASNTDPRPRAPWGAQIMVFADGGNLLQPVNGAAPEPVETVPAGIYDPSGIPSYAYAHVKSGGWRSDGEFAYIHVKSPLYVAADNVTVLKPPVYQPVRLRSSHPHTAPDGDWDAVYPGWDVPQSPPNGTDPYRKQVYVNLLNAVDYLRVGTDNNLYLTAAVTDHTLPPGDIRQYNVKPGVPVDEGYRQGEDIDVLDSTSNDENTFLSSAFIEPPVPSVDDVGYFTYGEAVRPTQTLTKCLYLGKSPCTTRTGIKQNIFAIRKVDLRTGAPIWTNKVTTYDPYNVANSLNKADALLPLPDGGFIFGTAWTGGTREQIHRLDSNFNLVGTLLYKGDGSVGSEGRPVNVIFADETRTSILILASNPSNVIGFEVRRYGVAGNAANNFDGWTLNAPKQIGTAFRSANPAACPKPEQCTAVAMMIKPNAPPVAACKNITVTIGPMGPVTVTAAQIDDGSADPDGDPVELALAGGSATFSTVGMYPLILTVTDSVKATLTDTCTAFVTVDAAPPVAVCADKALEYELGDGCETAEISAADLDGGSVAYGGLNLTRTISPTMLQGIGTDTVMLTIIDDLGRSDSCAVEVAAIDKAPPTITCPLGFSKKQRHHDATLRGWRRKTLAPSAEDNCSAATYTISELACKEPSKGGRGHDTAKCIVELSQRQPGSVRVKKAEDGTIVSFQVVATDEAGNVATKTCEVPVNNENS